MLGDDWLKLSSEDLYKEFDVWLRKIADDDYWSAENPDGQRIHWESSAQASKHKSKKSQFAEPGCYLFGWGSGYDKVIPTYVGETGASLRKRINGRYISGKYSQCRLAALFESILEKKGGEEHISHLFFKPGDNPGVRTKHALCFARLGMKELWFALIPTACEEQVEEIEGLKTLVAEGSDKTIHLNRDFRMILAREEKKKAAMKLEGNLIRAARKWNKNHNRKNLLNRL